MKVIYKPFGITLGIVAGLISKRIFDRIWAFFDHEDPPGATHRDAPLAKVLGAAVLEALTFRLTRVAVDRAGAHAFTRVTGSWPGETAEDTAEQD
jgi:hypothetical protein